MKPIIFLIYLTALSTSSFGGLVNTGIKHLLAPQTQNIIVSFAQGIPSVIQSINSLRTSNRNARTSKLIEASQTLTTLSQKPLQTFLGTLGVNFQSYWISNQMVVPNANSFLANQISQFPGVKRVEKEPIIEIEMIQGSGKVEEISRNAISAITKGVTKIEAVKTWSNQIHGKGVVVATIDSGARHTHEALRHNWRKEYGWFDPYENTLTPSDQNGHGTHVVGTIAGRYGIGVAPNATWIACKGCDTKCGASQLLACGQWILCPTKPDGTSKNCSMAPDIVSNSWSGGQDSKWFDDVVYSWRAAGIIPVFAIGNEGPKCGTASSPGDRSNNIAVGSTHFNDSISSFSSRGPTKGGNVKPDITAPGSDIYSAWHTNNRAYNTISGTSMACPHVSGVIALMLQKNPDLTYNQIYNVITKTAVKKGAPTCGGNGTAKVPNNVFGYGRIHALAAVTAVPERLKRG